MESKVYENWKITLHKFNLGSIFKQQAAMNAIMKPDIQIIFFEE